MTVADVIENARKERGIPVAELSRRTGIKYEALRVALNNGRKITGLELVNLCKELKLDVSDFPDEIEEPNLSGGTI